MPFEKARATLRGEYFDADWKYSWAGDGAFIMHDVLENRTMVQCIVAAVETHPPKDRKRDLTRELLTDTLSNWLDDPIAEGIRREFCSYSRRQRRSHVAQLMLDQPNPQGYSE